MWSIQNIFYGKKLNIKNNWILVKTKFHRFILLNELKEMSYIIFYGKKKNCMFKFLSIKNKFFIYLKV